MTWFITDIQHVVLIYQDARRPAAVLSLTKIRAWKCCYQPPRITNQTPKACFGDKNELLIMRQINLDLKFTSPRVRRELDTAKWVWYKNAKFMMQQNMVEATWGHLTEYINHQPWDCVSELNQHLEGKTTELPCSRRLNMYSSGTSDLTSNQLWMESTQFVFTVARAIVVSHLAWIEIEYLACCYKSSEQGANLNEMPIFQILQGALTIPRTGATVSVSNPEACEQAK